MVIYLQMIDDPRDRSKFEQLYTKYKDLMHYTAYKILRNDRDAEDAVHDAFLAIVRNIEKISFYNDSFQVQIYHNNQIAVSSTYAYTSITSITTTTSLYCFNIKLNKNYIIPIIKNSFIAGNESDFITFFKSKSLF